MNTPVLRPTLLVLGLLAFTACTSRGAAYQEAEAVAVEEELPAAPEPVSPLAVAPKNDIALEDGAPEVSLAVVETETPDGVSTPEGLDEIVVGGKRGRHEVIRDLVSEAQTLLRGVELEYVFTGKGKKEILRGRPVVFATWSEVKQEWVMVHVEIPRPPVKWRPGGRALAFLTRTPGVKAQHVKGTGAERLMFAFSRNGEDLKVYGRKFPVFDNSLLKKKQWRALAATAKPLVYLPYTEDTLDPLFVSGGRDFLLATARRAVDELRRANVPSVAFPGQKLADVVPPEVITSLAVIEQTDDMDFVEKGTGAFEEVLSQYGLKRTEAFRYSVSSANAIGPMQFTDRKGNGTYSLVVRRCRGANLDPSFERGSTDLLNAMKAAICLFDIELMQMRSDIRTAYWDNKSVLGIFPVAAYNGGPRNVTRLYKVMDRMKVRLEDLRRAGDRSPGDSVLCPCFWTQDGERVRPVAIPRYNNENRWYVEKYQNLLALFDQS
ncbi:MAG: hypothetical protein ABW136_08315 [Steroidobacteraceae bacterium]